MKKLLLPIVLLLAGCGEQVVREWSPTMKNPPVLEVKVGKPMAVMEMSDEDVVVAVNGVPLTKKEVDIRLNRYRFMLSRNPNMSAKDRDARYKMYGKTLIDSFINEQLFAWAGREKGVLTEKLLREIVASNVVMNARQFRLKPNQIDNAVPGGLCALCRSIEDIAWAKAYAEGNVAPDAEVDDEMVSNVVCEISLENSRIAASNRLVVARARQVRGDILAKRITFEAAAERDSSEFVNGESYPGWWGEFRPQDITDEKLRKTIFSLREGELSDVIEDDDGYMLVRPVEIGTGSRKFVRIVYPREPLVVLQDQAHLKRDLQHQMFTRGLKKKTAELYDAAKVVYPHGTNFWDSVSHKKTK